MRIRDMVWFFKEMIENFLQSFDHPGRTSIRPEHHG